MNYRLIRKIAREILAGGGMLVIDPTRIQSREIVKALRGHYDIKEVSDPIWREYITFREGTSNKYHYFAVMEKKNEDGSTTYTAANVYGRIGYPPREVVDLGEYHNKFQALGVAQKKLNSKLQKGYQITKLPNMPGL